jgi:DNA-binding transcriptional MerR regulator
MEIREKKFYPIREVAQITEVAESVIRFWEQNFEELNPLKNRVGQRKYTKKDIDIILLIKKLLYEDEYKISGAQRKLKELISAADGEQMELFPFQEKLKEEKLKEIRNELTEVLTILQ